MEKDTVGWGGRIIGREWGGTRGNGGKGGSTEGKRERDRWVGW